MATDEQTSVLGYRGGVALEALALLVIDFYPGIWEDLSQKRVATLIGVVVAITVLVVLLALGGVSLGWTGFSERKLWDWLQLLSALAIPVVLAVAGFWFTAQQEERQRELEVQRAQDAALQAYLDQMSSLMTGQNSLRNSEEDSEVRTLARARTLTVLGTLDPSRKTQVMQFLVEAGLVQRTGSNNPIIVDPINPGEQRQTQNPLGKRVSNTH